MCIRLNPFEARRARGAEVIVAMLTAVGRWAAVQACAAALSPRSNALEWAQQCVSTMHAASMLGTGAVVAWRLWHVADVARELVGRSEAITWRLHDDLAYFIVDTAVDVVKWLRTGVVRPDDMVCCCCVRCVLSVLSAATPDPLLVCDYVVCALVCCPWPSPQFHHVFSLAMLTAYKVCSVFGRGAAEVV